MHDLRKRRSSSSSGMRQPENLLIRTFEPAKDYLAVRALWEHAGPGVQLSASDSPTELSKKLARDPELFLVAQWEARLVGTVIGGFDGRRGLVYHLAVEQPMRRQGIGRALMRELEKRLGALGCRKCYLLLTRDNPDALAFYQEEGWEIMDLHVMGKHIE